MIVVVCTILLYAQLSLQSAQADALTVSPDVAIARGKVAEAQALYDQARATYGPAAIANYAQSPQAAASGASTVEQRLTTVGGSWTLGDLFANAPAVAQAGAVLQAARLSLNDAERSEQIAVINAYYAALAAQAAKNARAQELGAANAELRAANLRYSAGDAPRLDGVRAAVAVASAEADVARAQADADTAAETLAAQTGVAANAFETTVLNETAVAPFSMNADDAVALALARRPDVASARENVVVEERAVVVARRGSWPLVTLTGGYTTGVDTGIHVSGPSATVDVSLPVTGAARDRVLAQEARVVQARAELEKIVRSVRLEVGAAVRDYHAQSAALAASQRALQGARSEFAATQIGYRSGAVSSLDVEAARTTYVQALVNEISALYAQAKARAALNLLIGQGNG